MKIEYKIIANDDACKMGAPVPPYYSDWDDALDWDGKYNFAIWRCEDGVPVEWIEDDGGEPEDQTLYRNWSWVAPALQEAYELGRKHAD